VGAVIVAEFMIPLTVIVPAVAVIDPPEINISPVTVTDAELATPATVRVPELAVIDAPTTNDVLKDTIEVLEIPCTIRTPALAVTDPK